MIRFLSFFVALAAFAATPPPCGPTVQCRILVRSQNTFSGLIVLTSSKPIAEVWVVWSDPKKGMIGEIYKDWRQRGDFLEIHPQSDPDTKKWKKDKQYHGKYEQFRAVEK